MWPETDSDTDSIVETDTNTNIDIPTNNKGFESNKPSAPLISKYW